MSTRAIVYRVLIASPSDLNDDRERMVELFHEFNSLHVDEGIVFLPLLWEVDSVPEMGDRPQSILNRQLLSKADLLFAMFWTKLGTSTGVAVSGTAEEIQEFVKAKKPAAVYICNAKTSPDKIIPEQISALKTFKQSLFSSGVIGSYSTPEELKTELNKFLLKAKRDFKNDVQAAVDDAFDPVSTPGPSKLESLTNTLDRIISDATLEWDLSPAEDAATKIQVIETLDRELSSFAKDSLDTIPQNELHPILLTVRLIKERLHQPKAREYYLQMFSLGPTVLLTLKEALERIKKLQ